MSSSQYPASKGRNRPLRGEKRSQGKGGPIKLWGNKNKNKKSFFPGKKTIGLPFENSKIHLLVPKGDVMDERGRGDAGGGEGEQERSVTPA